jgi:hypothetical protein
MDKARESMLRPSVINTTLKAFDSQKTAMDRARDAMLMPSLTDITIKSLASQQSVMDKAREAMLRPSVIDIALKVFDSPKTAMDRAREAMLMPSLMDITLKSLASQQSVMDKAREVMLNPLILESVVTKFAVASSLLLEEPEYLLELTPSTSNFDASNLEKELSQSSEQFEKVSDVKSFIEVFNSLPSIVQAILLFLIMNVFLPQINSISANLLSPVVENYLEDNSSSERDKINLTTNTRHVFNQSFLTKNIAIK